MGVVELPKIMGGELQEEKDYKPSFNILNQYRVEQWISVDDGRRGKRASSLDGGFQRSSTFGRTRQEGHCEEEEHIFCLLNMTGVLVTGEQAFPCQD